MNSDKQALDSTIFQERRYYFKGKKSVEYWADIERGTYLQLPDSERRVLYTTPPASIPAPDGWVLVPVEPTERMVVDGFESEPNDTFSELGEWEKYSKMSGCQQAAYKARLCWAAMLAAAPAPGDS